MSQDAPQRLAEIHSELAKELAACGRAAGDVTVMAVSKTFPAEKIAPVLEAGHRVFGENRVQEAQAKWPALKADYPDTELHLIGPLQSNKAADAVALFDAIHSLDRLKLARVLAGEMHTQQRFPELFVQINTGEEPQKSGITPAEAGDFIKACREEYGLEIAGLMCLPPAEDVPAPHFALLEKIARAHDIKKLSMGMSGDYLAALPFGTTHIRLGSAIFGPRG